MIGIIGIVVMVGCIIVMMVMVVGCPTAVPSIIIRRAPVPRIIPWVMPSVIGVIRAPAVPIIVVAPIPWRQCGGNSGCCQCRGIECVIIGGHCCFYYDCGVVELAYSCGVCIVLIEFSLVDNGNAVGRHIFFCAIVAASVIFIHIATIYYCAAACGI